MPQPAGPNPQGGVLREVRAQTQPGVPLPVELLQPTIIQVPTPSTNCVAAQSEALKRILFLDLSYSDCSSTKVKKRERETEEEKKIHNEKRRHEHEDPLNSNNNIDTQQTTLPLSPPALLPQTPRSTHTPKKHTLKTTHTHTQQHAITEQHTKRIYNQPHSHRH